MKKPTPKTRLVTDAVAAMLLIATYLTGHADPHVHAFLGLLLAVAVIVHAVQAHRKIASTTRHLSSRSMDPHTKLDCCMGLAMALFLIAALASGVFLMKLRMAEGLSFDEAAGMPAGIVHMASAALFLICAVVHLVLNKEGFERLLQKERAA
ncbi:MAG: cytochrome b/b6 domain-containing protein [Atopobiaceae bacterium]|jgi:hypothetical protein|nr:cytochrome b/b6 domain-containing protein [Atopobiaceae bacterium]